MTVGLYRQLYSDILSMMARKLHLPSPLLVLQYIRSIGLRLGSVTSLLFTCAPVCLSSLNSKTSGVHAYNIEQFANNNKVQCNTH